VSLLNHDFHRLLTRSRFDLWEEVFSSSYFTAAAQHRALKEGAALAERIDHKAAVSLYDLESDNILCYMQSFWNPDKGYMTANTGGGRSGIDSNTILASIHLFDPEAGCDPLTLQPCSDRALSNLKVLVDSFRSIYKINEGIPLNDAVAIGRYAEDVYYNGNVSLVFLKAVIADTSIALVLDHSCGRRATLRCPQCVEETRLPGSHACFHQIFQAVHPRNHPRNIQFGYINL